MTREQRSFLFCKMRLSVVLLKQVSRFRFSNYVPTNRIPGNVLLG